jgi:hypothetical protein
MGAWSAMKSGLGNHTARTLDELEAVVRGRLRQIQRQPDLINALLGRSLDFLLPGFREITNGEHVTAEAPSDNTGDSLCPGNIRSGRL